jgi:hypothetical protein
MTAVERRVRRNLGGARIVGVLVLAVSGGLGLLLARSL